MGWRSSKSPLFSESNAQSKKFDACGKPVPMSAPHRFVILSNVYDENYQKARGEEIPPCLSSPKRRDLFTAIQLALGWELVILSSPPRASVRRHGRWLPLVDTRFDRFPQHFCANWDLPKLRIPFSWVMYALHVARHVRKGDVLMMDNFELIYVLAAWLCRLLYGCSILLDYEDGKHLTDRGWPRLISGPAEELGRALIQGAILAHPCLGERLPARIPKVTIPGFYKPGAKINRPEHPLPKVHFIYAGSLDEPRGMNLLIQALPYLPKEGWRLDITGSGPFADTWQSMAQDCRFSGKLFFHGVISAEDHARLLGRCHVGLNLQLGSDPISTVTFPSKIFSYLSAGLEVISTEASGVKDLLGEDCIYLSEENPRALAAIMADRARFLRPQTAPTAVGNFSIPSTAVRLKAFFQEVWLKRP
ncbi:glycosyltransferase family 1 protein [bacterium]|nr:glycosyltransferase family 1 protein [bacterium]